MVKQKLQKSVSEKDKRIHNDRNRRRTKFSKLAEKEGVKKKLYCGQSTVVLLPTLYMMHCRHLEKGVTLWNNCKALLEANNYFGIPPLFFLFKKQLLQHARPQRRTHVVMG